MSCGIVAGPGTVLCDQVCYIFMFLSVATSNLIATSLAQKVGNTFRCLYSEQFLVTGDDVYDCFTSQKREEAKHHLSRMLFLALACGFGLFVISEVFVTQLLQGDSMSLFF